ncbi:MAG TPA: c-type cytochrome biogenesis protein CcmI, partial [Hyphomicrobiaceae bacterium]|nr:c-type cytochrome biogenesis protein CcmI [Hyphomicrobiaceae bacterium]
MFLLWLSFACLAAAVVMALLRPLARDLGAGEPVSQVATDADVAVYKDQLTEIEAEQRRGIIGAAEAEAARI